MKISPRCWPIFFRAVRKHSRFDNFKKVVKSSLLIPTAFLAACNSNAIFEEEKTFPANQWTYRDSIDFKFKIADTSAVYSLALDFEHGLDYPLQNVYVKLFTRFPDGRRPGKAISVDFFDAQGKANGKISGKTSHLRAVLQENAFFNQPGDYGLTIHQFSRRDSLPGISKVGLVVEKTGKR